jgi:hypothetical protein
MKMIETKLPSPPATSSALGRPPDPRFLSNIIAITGALATGVLFWVLGNALGYDIASSPVGGAGAVFLAWAIAREIDPDRNGSAYIAMVISFALALWLAPSLLLGFGILVGTRLISSTVGLPLKTLDLVALVAIGALLGSGRLSIAGIAALVAGVLVSDRLSVRSLVTSFLIALAAGAVFVLFSDEVIWESPGLGTVALSCVLLAGLLVSLRVPRCHATTDIGNHPIDAKKVMLSRVALLATVGLGLLVAGAAGLEAGLGVAGAALLGTAATSLRLRLG